MECLEKFFAGRTRATSDLRCIFTKRDSGEYELWDFKQAKAVYSERDDTTSLDVDDVPRSEDEPLPEKEP